MQMYDGFAQVYDLFMDNVDYRGWGDYLIRRLRQYGVQDGLVCELGCGTGNMTEILAEAGYDMIGIDASDEMLDAAQKKRTESGSDILYLMQDMREFELYGTVRAVVSVCDSLNYITEERDLLEVFRLVNNYLDPDGVFLFDMNMPAKYEKIGSATIAENREEGSFIWENEYDAQQGINDYLLTLFIPEGEEGLFRRYEEEHVQRAYSLQRIRDLLQEAGMTFLGAWEAYTDRMPAEDSGRVFFAARENGKNERIRRHLL